MGTMTRTERLLRLARQRGDLLAVATLDPDRKCRQCGNRQQARYGQPHECPRWWLSPLTGWTEAELREAWGR